MSTQWVKIVRKCEFFLFIFTTISVLVVLQIMIILMLINLSQKVKRIFPIYSFRCPNNFISIYFYFRFFFGSSHIYVVYSLAADKVLLNGVLKAFSGSTATCICVNKFVTKSEMPKRHEAHWQRRMTGSIRRMPMECVHTDCFRRCNIYILR